MGQIDGPRRTKSSRQSEYHEYGRANGNRTRQGKGFFGKKLKKRQEKGKKMNEI
jgi:hypothetical protein